MPDPGPLGKVLLSDRCYASTALMIASSRFGTDMLQWEPGVLAAEVEKEFGIELPETTYNKLNAAVLLVNTDFYYKKLNTFIVVNNVLYNGDFDDGSLSPEEICWGITEAQFIWPQGIPNSPYELFVPEIVDLIRFTMNYYGVLVSPEVLKLVGMFFDDLNPALEEFRSDPFLYGSIFESVMHKTRALNIHMLQKISELIHQINSCGIALSYDDVFQTLLGK